MDTLERSRGADFQRRALGALKQTGNPPLTALLGQRSEECPTLDPSGAVQKVRIHQTSAIHCLPALPAHHCQKIYRQLC
ncbi:hypothetical protein Celaphus_00019373, partial [Cervus elaphus hippelaphus]